MHWRIASWAIVVSSFASGVAQAQEPGEPPPAVDALPPPPPPSSPPAETPPMTPAPTPPASPPPPECASFFGRFRALMEKTNRVYGLAVLALAAVLSTWIAASTWQRVKTWRANTIDVTGSAKRRITSDLIVWEASVATHASDRQAAYRELKTSIEKTLDYLDEHGISATEISVQSVETKPLVDKEVTGTGAERIEKEIDRGFETSQVIRVTSTRVAEVERVSREVTELIDADVPVVSNPPRYLYTKLGDLKIEMLAEASKDARTRAERILASAGNAGVGKLRKADMGVINVNPANSTDTSWDGNNDTSSVDKDIVTIVHCTFDME